VGKSGLNPALIHDLQEIGVAEIAVEFDYASLLYNVWFKCNFGYESTVKIAQEAIDEGHGVVLLKAISDDIAYIKKAHAQQGTYTGSFKSVNQVTLKHTNLTYHKPDQIQKAPMEPTTFKYQMKQRPGVLRRDMSNVSCKNVASATAQYYLKNNDKAVMPEHDAVNFYLLNHGMAEMAKRVNEDEMLSQEYMGICSDYHDVLADAGLRLFYYLLLICTRESRHANSYDNESSFLAAEKYCPQSLTNFIRKLPDDSISAAEAFMNMTIDEPIGKYTRLMVFLFNNAKWSSSFGGKKWGVVADALDKYVHGVYSLQLLLDVGFALAHNGGPIFNKHMLYQTYNAKELRTILDVQRAGQIPQFVNTFPVGKYNTERHVAYLHMLRDALGDCMDGVVDWGAVKAAGALGNYSDYASVQTPSKHKHTIPGGAKLKHDSEGHFHVMPDVHVQYVE
jgi:hypothetical protein